MSERRVLILCTGNSCRSQMAEGLVNVRLANTWRAYSAGTRPAGYVHPLAVRVMQEWGIDLSEQRSKSTDEFLGHPFDLVITVCDSAAEDCPVWLGKNSRVHIGFPDPAHAVGSADERLAVFRQVRDDMARRIVDYLEDFS